MKYSPSPSRDNGRQHKRGKRTKKIEVKLTPRELDEVRQRFGRQAPDIARRAWLSGSPAKARQPSMPKQKMLEIATALHVYRETLLPLRSAVGADPAPIRAKQLLAAEEKAFNHLTHVWFSNYSVRAK